ncbi:hypothetical protein BV25DRAFT_977774 [Artomyces pyxidatus]|uniref:Uncharacterized protein n=1 Tax=Artomyces pyxidatus TaxID=48021 RepID=A0ACB8SUN8_9AGAM|nr:hypothetical protein BV25DRAFT_977774 [Artomyces pyxidatus]
MYHRQIAIFFLVILVYILYSIERGEREIHELIVGGGDGGGGTMRGAARGTCRALPKGGRRRSRRRDVIRGRGTALGDRARLRIAGQARTWLGHLGGGDGTGTRTRETERGSAASAAPRDGGKGLVRGRGRAEVTAESCDCWGKCCGGSKPLIHASKPGHTPPGTTV